MVLYQLIHKGRFPVTSEKEMMNHFAVKFRPSTSAACRDLLSRLLKKSPGKRLGCSRNSPRCWKEIKKHEFFEPLDWDHVHAQDLKPPLLIENGRLYFSFDTAAIESFPLKKRTKISPATDLKYFGGIEFNTDLSRSNIDEAINAAKESYHKHRELLHRQK